MSDKITNGGVFYAPESMRSKVWRWLGFRYRFDEDLFEWRNKEPPEEGLVVGCLTTDVHVRVSFLDRVRILISGHVKLSVYTKTNVAVDRAVSRSSFAVLPPRTSGMTAVQVSERKSA